MKVEQTNFVTHLIITAEHLKTRLLKLGQISSMVMINYSKLCAS